MQDTMLADCPLELWRVRDQLRGLRYDSRPDYEAIRAALLDVCRRYGFSDDHPLDWEPGGRHRQCVLRRLAQNQPRPLPDRPANDRPEPMPAS